MNDAALYVSNADSRDIHVLRLDRARGTLERVQVVDTGGTVMPLALGPDKRFLYAALRSDPFTVASFAIDPKSGSLTSIGTAPLPDSMANLMVDRTGRWLFAASYGGHRISMSPIGPDRVAKAATAVVPTGKNAHAAIVDAANRNLYVTNLGSDQVLHYEFDAATGALSPGDPLGFKSRAGAGPRHIVFSQSGKHAWLLNELDATLDVLAVGTRGSLSLIQTVRTMPADATVKPWAADIHLTPDARFLYTSERNTHTLAIFKVDAGSGKVTPAGHQPTEQQPRGFQVDSTGSWLFVVGQASHRMTAYRIDGDTGALAQAAQLPMGRNPNWIEIVDLR